MFVVKDYHIRRAICENFKRETGSLNYNFKNQSFSSIAMSIFTIKIVDTIIQLGTLQIITIPNLFTCYLNIKKCNEKIVVEYPKSYSNAVVKYFKGVKLPVLNISDNFINTNFSITQLDDNKLYLIDDVYYRGGFNIVKKVYAHILKQMNY